MNSISYNHASLASNDDVEPLNAADRSTPICNCKDYISGLAKDILWAPEQRHNKALPMPDGNGYGPLGEWERIQNIDIAK